MKDAQTATRNRDSLIDYIMRLTPAQCDKLIKRLPLLEQVANMSENEQIFAERFLSRVCGKVNT